MTKRPVALVTGGARGIGLGIARALAQEGCILALNGRRPREEVEEALVNLRGRGVDAEYFAADIASESGRQHLLDGVLATFGRIDVLVNNAGVAPERREDILEASVESFHRVVSTNLEGPYFLTQAVARHMIQARQHDASGYERPPRACIIFVTSVSASVASVNRGDYCISKAGLSMAARLWAVRLAEYGIPVYEVRPGIIATDMTAGVRDRYDRLLAEGLALEPRWGTPQDVGRAVATLVRGDIPYATGSILCVDGGMTVPRL